MLFRFYAFVFLQHEQPASPPTLKNTYHLVSSRNLSVKPVHVHDLHATILHLSGIDHTKLTYHYSGRDFRLTDVARVIHDLLA